jgi:hypothetical protein
MGNFLYTCPRQETVSRRGGLLGSSASRACCSRSPLLGPLLLARWCCACAHPPIAPSPAPHPPPVTPCAPNPVLHPHRSASLSRLASSTGSLRAVRALCPLLHLLAGEWDEARASQPGLGQSQSAAAARARPHPPRAPGCNCLNPLCGEAVAGVLSLRIQQLDVQCACRVATGRPAWRAVGVCSSKQRGAHGGACRRRSWGC